MSRSVRRAAPAAPHLARAALVAAAVVALGVFHVWSRTRVVAVGYALGELQNEHTKLESEHDRLRIEVETLRSPAALERFARTRLGMAPPEPGAVSAAGPLLAEAGADRAGGTGVDHRSGPAEPVSVREGGRAAAAPFDPGALRAPPLGVSGSGPEGPADSGGRLAFRGPLRAGFPSPRGR